MLLDGRDEEEMVGGETSGVDRGEGNVEAGDKEGGFINRLTRFLILSELGSVLTGGGEEKAGEEEGFDVEVEGEGVVAGAAVRGLQSLATGTVGDEEEVLAAVSPSVINSDLSRRCRASELNDTFRYDDDGGGGGEGRGVSGRGRSNSILLLLLACSDMRMRSVELVATSLSGAASAVADAVIGLVAFLFRLEVPLLPLLRLLPVAVSPLGGDSGLATLQTTPAEHPMPR